MVIPREISATPDRDFGDDKDRDFEPLLQPEEEREDSQEPHERTTKRHTEDPVAHPPQEDGSGYNGNQLRRLSLNRRCPAYLDDYL